MLRVTGLAGSRISPGTTMSWLNNRKIIFKVCLIVVLLAIVAAGAVTFASFQMREIDATYSDLVTRVDKTTTAVGRSGRYVEAYVGLAFRLAVETTEEGNRRILSAIEKERSSYERTLADALKAIPEKASLLEPLRATFDNVFKQCDAAIKFAATTTTAEDNAKSLMRLTNECVPVADAALADQSKMTNELERDAAQQADDLKVKTNRTVMTVALSVTVGLALSLVISLFIAIKGLSQPIAQLKSIMEKFATNDLKHDVPGTGRGDEVGDMARTVEVFRTNGLEVERLKNEQQANEDRSELQRRADMQKLANDFEGAVGEIIQTVSSAATELEASANSLTSTAARTEELSTVVAAASEEASANVQSVASASEEMASSVNEISRQVQDSARIASDAVKQAELTNNRVIELSQAASKIGDVVELINTIAGQTNLLALNATIEAARAGDAGRGFAVVASEVKSLAEQTSKATGEIADQIKGIQTATSDSVEAIKDIGITIRRISEISSTIASAVEEQGAATQEISRNVQQASRGTSQVASNISDVQRGSSETGSASSQVLSSAQSLAVESNRLKTEVSKFLGTVRAA